MIFVSVIWASFGFRPWKKIEKHPCKKKFFEKGQFNFLCKKKISLKKRAQITGTKIIFKPNNLII